MSPVDDVVAAAQKKAVVFVSFFRVCHHYNDQQLLNDVMDAISNQPLSSTFGCLYVGLFLKVQFIYLSHAFSPKDRISSCLIIIIIIWFGDTVTVSLKSFTRSHR